MKKKLANPAVRRHVAEQEPLQEPVRVMPEELRVALVYMPTVCDYMRILWRYPDRQVTQALTSMRDKEVLAKLLSYPSLLLVCFGR